MNEQPPLRRIRSFVRREGRLTKGQQRALQELWPLYGIDAGDTPLNFDALFGRHAPRTLEIGFGNGASLATMAQRQPDTDFIGIEVHRPGVGNLLLQIEALGLTNLRLMCADAVTILEQQIPDASLDRVLLFFPDPWHKKRHYKRRLVQAPFVALIARKLKPGAILHLATDWAHYAEHMMAVLSACEYFENCADSGQYASRPDYRPLTKFEQRGQRLGHGVWDLIFRRC